MPAERKKIGSLLGVLGSITGVLGLMVSIIALWNSHLALEITKTIATTEMITNLHRDFNSVKLFREIRSEIESCKPIYKSYGGRFHHDEVNQYLNFYEELGYLQKQGYLSLKDIDFFFGSYLIEAYRHPGIFKYIENFQANGQSDAFTEFQKLAQTINDSNTGRIELGMRFETACKIALGN